MTRKLLVFLALGLFTPLIFLSGCKNKQPQISNPASEFCEMQDGAKIELRVTIDGTVGYCLFRDGSECEEWAYYRGDCNPGDQFPDDPGIK